jgi:hypothetical protein
MAQRIPTISEVSNACPVKREDETLVNRPIIMEIPRRNQEVVLSALEKKKNSQHR